MTKIEFDVFCIAIERALGNPEMTWEGPEPHDFRNMKERGVRFVHSPLYAKCPEWATGLEDYAPDGIVHFRIAVGDDAAMQDIGSRISALGYTWERSEWKDGYWWITFDVVVNSST